MCNAFFSSHSPIASKALEEWVVLWALVLQCREGAGGRGKKGEVIKFHT